MGYYICHFVKRNPKTFDEMTIVPSAYREWHGLRLGMDGLVVHKNLKPEAQ